MLDLFSSALIAGCGVAATAGPLGCFVVWRKMAYFGDTLSHSALLGVSLGLLLNININIAIIFCALLLAIVLSEFQDRRQIASDTLLGILAHSSLSLGLVAVSFADNVRIDMMAYLFGDLLSVSLQDIFWIYGGGTVVITMMIWLWRPLLAMSVHAELAQVEGVPVKKIRLALTVIMALVIAISMKIIGVLLITSLLIIPAATAQRFAKSPEQMAVKASLFGMLGVTGGLVASWYIDTPAGPSVVVACFVLFLLSQLLPLKT
ncbi:MAG: zinc ABC transporter permease subunit ZnuB [Candidatus Endonucleobacter sp. (ex Gigantidas childressi)]|nr:zinc ABC transporter permease subunit ZnuB [Candidatus Endonucleobacter sp. (ex Gigantidas childressi)]